MSKSDRIGGQRQVWMLVAALLATGGLEARDSGQQSVTAESWPGVVPHTVTTRAGRVTVYLPDDIRAGDTISGTVLAEPAGRTERQQRRNRDTLNGYVYDAEASRVRQTGNILTLVAPAAGLMTLLVSPDGGGKLAATQIEVNPQGNLVPSPDLPRVGQAGRSVRVDGAFDGDMANTMATLGNVPVEIVAESPRTSMFRAPDEPIGPGTLVVRDAGAVRETEFNNVAVGLGTDKAMLQRGESTRLTVIAEGLPAATGSGPSELVLVGSPTIPLEAGNTQSMALEPDGNGNATLQRQITAASPRNFEISALLMARPNQLARAPLFSDALRHERHRQRQGIARPDREYERGRPHRAPARDAEGITKTVVRCRGRRHP